MERSAWIERDKMVGLKGREVLGLKVKEVQRVEWERSAGIGRVRRVRIERKRSAIGLKVEEN